MLPREEYDFAETDAIQFATHLEKDQYDNGSWIILSGSEKDLIAHYIFSAYTFPENLYNDERPFWYIKADGTWKRFADSKLSADKRKFEKKSYFLDHLVRDLLINSPDGDRISKALYQLDRLQRTRLIDEFFKFHDSTNAQKPRPDLHRSNMSFGDRHFIFIFYDRATPLGTDEVLNGFIDKSLHHHNYLKNYKCQEVVAIGFSNDFESCAFGYISTDDALSEEEKVQMEQSYKELGWKVRTQ
jgi:hypothetical protein